MRPPKPNANFADGGGRKLSVLEVDAAIGRGIGMGIEGGDVKEEVGGGGKGRGGDATAALEVKGGTGEWLGVDGCEV